MTTDTLTLTAFLLARIDDDEAVANAAGSGVWSVPCSFDGDFVTDSERALHVAGPSHAEECAIEGDDIRIYDEGGHDEHQAAHIARHNPAHVIAECAAKRAIVEGHRGLHVCPNLTDEGYTDYSADDGDDGYRPCPTMLAILNVYADHPDYRHEWAS